MGDPHRRESGCAHKHPGNNHWLRAKTVGNRAAKNAQPLLDELAQSERNADHQCRPAHLVDKANGDQWKHHEKA